METMKEGGCPCGVVANMLGCNIVVSEFKHQLCYYVHFWTNILGKDMNLLVTPPPAMG